jgi:DNA-binding NarL/FixJ family response regulator
MSGRGDSSNGTGIGVLVCDDHPAMRAVLREVIELRGSLRLVGVAADGNEVIAKAAMLQPDVILLDLAMPNRTGLEALRELKQVAPAARIVIFSGFSAASVAEEVLELGAVLYLEKGATPDAINDALEQAASQTSSDALPARPGTSGRHARRPNV